MIPPRMAQRILVCVAPLNDVEFQLRQGDLVLKVPSISASPERVSFYLKFSHVGDQSPFTCRYRLNSISDWSENSNPVEIMWSDGEFRRRVAGQGRLQRHRWKSEVSRMGPQNQNPQT